MCLTVFSGALPKCVSTAKTTNIHRIVFSIEALLAGKLKLQYNEMCTF